MDITRDIVAGQGGRSFGFLEDLTSLYTEVRLTELELDAAEARQRGAAAIAATPAEVVNATAVPAVQPAGFSLGQRDIVLLGVAVGLTGVLLALRG